MKIEISYNTVTGGYSKTEMEVSDLMENILPDMRPPLINITIDAVTVDNKKVFIDIGPSGVIVRDAVI